MLQTHLNFRLFGTKVRKIKKKPEIRTEKMQKIKAIIEITNSRVD